MTKRTTISYPDWLHARIEMLIGAGVVDSQSDFFRQASTSHLLILETGAQTIAQAEGIDTTDVPSSVEALLGEVDD